MVALEVIFVFGIRGFGRELPSIIPYN